MEEEEDRILLSNLGVSSAAAEDIERKILADATAQEINDVETSGEVERIAEKEGLDRFKITDTSTSIHDKLYSKLRTIEFEIDAVKSTVKQVRSISQSEKRGSYNDGGRHEGENDDVRSVSEARPNDLTLQHALASDRLRDLKKTKARLEKEFSELCKTSSTDDHDKLIRDLVRDEPRTKRRFKEVQKLSQKANKRQKTVSFDEDGDFDAVLDSASAGFVETERDELIRKGLSTPFHKLKGFERSLQAGPSSRHRLSEEHGNTDDIDSACVARAANSISKAEQARPTTKLLDSNDLPKLDRPTRPFHRLKTPLKLHTSSDSEGEKKKERKKKRKRPLPGKKWRKRISNEERTAEENEDTEDKLPTSTNEEDNQEDVEDSDDNETLFVTLEGGLKIPETIFNQLFDYQKVGVQWLWELHCQRAGGIIGDEMGLGKTIQVLSFLGALHFSNMYKPSIIVCPVTLLRQWKREAQKWYPSFRVEILHDSAQDLVKKKKRSENDGSDYETDVSLDSDNEEKFSSKNSKKWDSLIKCVLRSDAGLLITTYEQLRILGETLIDIEWGYAVLDEGHRIRNPNADVTLVCKQLQTVHRVIMTGAPIQNKLSELWSLFDFVFPGKLGVLPVFEVEFAVPISVGGYANASPLQVSTAYRCAVVLRDLIMPYLLRRMKADVNANLTKKTEHVLFCSLTAEQRSVYRAFLASSEVEQIFDGNRNSLYGIDVMRKICNHPDLLERDHAYNNPDYGNFERSGKMKVVAQVLKGWKEQSHRVLLFSQTQQMLDILESFLIANEYTYRRMDGATPIKLRMALIDEFNNSSDVFIFILTTKVGGLGTNLTGANRVIIFDPDWNPSTDMQARERAWRIGQKRDVTVYRLITRGTIEEKVYHRQIYKHFLTNKILKNPQQRRFFKSRDMKDLFTLNEDGDGDGSTETSNIFGQLSENINVVGDHKDNIMPKFSTAATPHTIEAVVSKDDNLEAGPSTNHKGKEIVDQKNREVDEETNILKSLFDAQGIHSAVNHDVIMNAHGEEKMRLEEQASQVAQRAAEALRQSRMIRSRDSISTPTWTGKSGAAGAPLAVRQKFGSTVNTQLIRSTCKLSDASTITNCATTSKPNGFSAGASSGTALSSSDLLARIRKNKESAVSDGLDQHVVIASSSNSSNRTRSLAPNLSSVQPEILIRQICTFIHEKGGRSNSSSLVDHFKDKIPSKDLPLFKNLLKEIAILQKDPNGSMWILKPDYH